MTDDEHIEALINNEKDWRRYLVKKMDAMQQEHVGFHKDLSSIKVWNKIWRLVGGSILGLLMYFVRDRLP